MKDNFPDKYYTSWPAISRIVAEDVQSSFTHKFKLSDYNQTLADYNANPRQKAVVVRGAHDREEYMPMKA